MNILYFHFTKDNLDINGFSVERLCNEFIFNSQIQKDGTYIGIRREDFPDNLQNNRARMITVDQAIMNDIQHNAIRDELS